jgi:adenosylcobinamide kinase/adenosylcobinamide-phosphate guanylyltransferase
MKTLVIGGARSGKSRAAESLVAQAASPQAASPQAASAQAASAQDASARGADVTYVATAYAPGDDVEWQERVALHRSRRPAEWATLESIDLVGLLSATGGPLLVDCLTLWLTRMMDRHDCWDDRAWVAGGGDALRAESDALVAALRATSREVVMVTNEVGQGVVPATASGRRFRDEMGLLNTAVAAECGDVLWCVAGRVVRL